jgi:hypothetical protein
MLVARSQARHELRALIGVAVRFALTEKTLVIDAVVSAHASENAR